MMGVNLNMAWKGFDFSALIQGAFGAKVYWQHAAYNTPTVRFGYQINKEVADGRWVEGRTDATYPRLVDYQDEQNTKLSDFYLENKSFLKIRNVQLGYTLPKALTMNLTLKEYAFTAVWRTSSPLLSTKDLTQKLVEWLIPQ